MSLTNSLPADAARGAKSASHVLATLPSEARNFALTAIHDALSQAKDEILSANARDLEVASKAAENGELSLSIVSRLDLGKKVIALSHDGIFESRRQVGVRRRKYSRVRWCAADVPVSERPVMGC